MKTVSVIIPAYNEEKRIAKTLNDWQVFLNKKNDKFLINKIIIVDDGSTDKTIKVALSFNNLPIKIIDVKPNQGKGNAVKAGVINAESDLIYIYDADGAVKPQELEKLVEGIKNSDVAIGSRIFENLKNERSFIRKFVGKCFHMLCWPLIPNIKDASCGAKLFKKDCAKKIFGLQEIKRFAFDIEILWLAKKLGYKVNEIGVSWQEIPGSKVNIIKDSLEMFISVVGLYKKQLFKNKK